VLSTTSSSAEFFDPTPDGIPAVREYLLSNFVKGGHVLEVENKQRDADDVGDFSAGRFDDRLNVLPNLPRLCLSVIFADELKIWSSATCPA
jgi:hypothetical protein